MFLFSAVAASYENSPWTTGGSLRSKQDFSFKYWNVYCLYSCCFHPFQLFDLYMQADSHGYEAQVCLQTLWDIIQPLGTVNHGKTQLVFIVQIATTGTRCQFHAGSLCQTLLSSLSVPSCWWHVSHRSSLLVAAVALCMRFCRSCQSCDISASLCQTAF